MNIDFGVKMQLKFGLMMSFLCLSAPIVAYDASPRCYKYLQMGFFQERLVYEAFSLRGVPQGAWPTIFRDLDEQQKFIPGRIREVAGLLNPNPLDPVFIPEVARKVLLDVLFRTFSTVMRIHDLSNDADITAMFNFILSKQIGVIDSCIPLPQEHPNQGKPLIPN